jgi:hypothetical protein
MGCGCQGASAEQIVYTADAPPQPLAQNSKIEYVVRFADGSYSESLPSMEDAFQMAGALGGQARARAKVPATA